MLRPEGERAKNGGVSGVDKIANRASPVGYGRGQFFGRITEEIKRSPYITI